MNFTTESPFAPVKKVVLEYLRSGCPAHNVNPHFVPVEGCLPWHFVNEDEFVPVNPPGFVVAMDGTPDPVSETWPQGWIIPLVVVFFAPQSATEEWLQEVQEALFKLFHGIWHANELANPAENTPLAMRLTAVALTMPAPSRRLYVRYTTAAVPRRFETIGQSVEIRMDLDVCCAMREAH
jgi:hypothetical protein